MPWYHNWVLYIKLNIGHCMNVFFRCLQFLEKKSLQIILSWTRSRGVMRNSEVVRTYATESCFEFLDLRDEGQRKRAISAFSWLDLQAKVKWQGYVFGLQCHQSTMKEFSKRTACWGVLGHAILKLDYFLSDQFGSQREPARINDKPCTNNIRLLPTCMLLLPTPFYLCQSSEISKKVHNPGQDYITLPSKGNFALLIKYMSKTIVIYIIEMQIAINNCLFLRDLQTCSEFFFSLIWSTFITFTEIWCFRNR